MSKHPELGVQLDSPTKDEELTVCKCSQLRPYLELDRSADIVGQCKGPICSTELPPAVQRLRGSAGQCRPLQWCLGVGDDITLGA